MNTINLTCVTLLITCLSGQSQVLLNTGESFIFEFASLPLDHIDSTGVVPVLLGGFGVGTSIFGTSASYRLEMFENSASEAPLMSSDFPGGLGVIGAWQDLQGVARVTMLNGSMQLNYFVVKVTTPGERPDPNFPPINFSVYQAEFSAVVPEPTTLGLLGLIALAGLGWRAAVGKKQK